MKQNVAEIHEKALTTCWNYDLTDAGELERSTTGNPWSTFIMQLDVFMSMPENYDRLMTGTNHSPWTYLCTMPRNHSSSMIFSGAIAKDR